MRAIQKLNNIIRRATSRVLFGHGVASAQDNYEASHSDGIASKALLGHGVASARRDYNTSYSGGIASAALQGTGSCPPVVTGATPLARSVVTSAAPLDSSTRDSHNTYSANSNQVLRHGLFLSLYSLIKKASGKLPWRSRTNHNSSFSSSSSNYSLSGTRNYIKNFRRIRILGSASLFSLGLLLLATFVPLYNVTRTEDTEAAAGTAKDSSITFTATRSTASVDLTVTSENGTFASSTDGTNGTTDTRAAFSLSTTNFTGYTLTIASNTNTSALTNNNGGSLSSISSSIDESTFNTTTYNNQWGYKPNYYGSSANTNFLPSPTTTAITLDATTTANTTAKNYTIALGARADYTNASGTYSSSNYKLMYVANPVAHSITFADNSGDSTVANIPAVQSSDSVTTSTIVLTSATPTRTGYNFKSWCLGTVSSNGTVCTGTEYASGASFGIDRTTSKLDNTTTLYAKWQVIPYVQNTYVRYQNADGTYGGYSLAESRSVNFGENYSYATNGGDGATYQTGSTSYTVTGAKDNYITVDRQVYTCYIQVRYQDAAGNYGGYSEVVNTTMRAGNTCAWGRAADAYYQYSGASAAISGNISWSLDVNRQVYTCYIQSRHQNADGGYTGYTARVNQAQYAGSTCAWGVGADAAYQAASYSAELTGNIGASIDINRNTYAVDVNPVINGTVYGGGLAGFTFDVYLDGGLNGNDVTDWYNGSIRYGQTIRVIANGVGGYNITAGDLSYTVTGGLDIRPTWLDNVAPVLTNWWWGETNVNVARLYIQAWDAAGVKTVQCPTSTASGGYGNWVWFNAVWDSGANAYRCDITPATFGHYDQTYITHLYMWDNRDNGGYIAQTSVAIPANWMWFQDATSANCGMTMRDNRGDATYKAIDYSTAMIGGLCWMTRNLDLPGGTTLSQSDSNLNGTATSYTLRTSSTSGFNDYTIGWVYNSGRTTCSSDSSTGSCYSYYSYAAATAGTNPSSGEASSDICPYGWRLPTKAEYDTLKVTYTTGATLTASPFYGVYSGNYNNGSYYNGGLRGFYHSSTSIANYTYHGNEYGLYFDSSSTSADALDKGGGFAVRCVAKS